MVTVPMSTQIGRGTQQVIHGRLRVYYDGYWIKAYDVPADTLLAKKRLIEALTRRLFNHTEHGINIPGGRLEEARLAFDTEPDPQRRRIKGGTLAGALFNRAADIITKLVEIQAMGVVIQPDNELMRHCGEHLREALELGKMVLHRSGDEGIDELWGEPFKAFAYPIEEFYKSRYMKIAMTMSAIDLIAAELLRTFGDLPMFHGLEPLVASFATAAKAKSETLRTDPEIFEVWTSFVASAEKLAAFEPVLSACPSSLEQDWAQQGMQLVNGGKELVSYITRARVPMPKSTREWSERCERYRLNCAVRRENAVSVTLIS